MTLKKGPARPRGKEVEALARQKVVENQGSRRLLLTRMGSPALVLQPEVSGPWGTLMLKNSRCSS